MLRLTTQFIQKQTFPTTLLTKLTNTSVRYYGRANGRGGRGRGFRSKKGGVPLIGTSSSSSSRVIGDVPSFLSQVSDVMVDDGSFINATTSSSNDDGDDDEMVLENSQDRKTEHPLAHEYSKLPRLYTPHTQQQQQPQEGQPLTKELTQDNIHYLIKVMRVHKSLTREFRVFNELFGEWVCTLNGTSSEKVTAVYSSCIRSPDSISSVGIIPEKANLYQCLIKKERMKGLVEKVTELDVGSITFLDSEFTDGRNVQEFNKVGKDKKGGGRLVDKLRMIGVEGAEQSERLDVPGLREEVVDMVDVFDWEFDGGGDEGERNIVIALVERSGSSKPLLNVLDDLLLDENQNDKVIKNVSFLVGPEGGWSQTEIQIFNELAKNTKKVGWKEVYTATLTGNVLRSETAGVMAIGVYGVWNSSIQIFNKL